MAILDEILSHKSEILKYTPDRNFEMFLYRNYFKKKEIELDHSKPQRTNKEISEKYQLALPTVSLYLRYTENHILYVLENSEGGIIYPEVLKKFIKSAFNANNLTQFFNYLRSSIVYNNIREIDRLSQLKEFMFGFIGFSSNRMNMLEKLLNETNRIDELLKLESDI